MALIRKEVAESRAMRDYGSVVLAVERSSSMILLIALGFICAALALASHFSYTSRVRVPGVVDNGRAILFVPPDQLPRIRIGQAVTLRLAGYAPDAAGRMTGTVSAIAEAPGTRVTVALGAQGAQVLPAGTRLDAAIDVERHRLIGWLFRPMLQVFERID